LVWVVFILEKNHDNGFGFFMYGSDERLSLLSREVPGIISKQDGLLTGLYIKDNN